MRKAAQISQIANWTLVISIPCQGEILDDARASRSYDFHIKSSTASGFLQQPMAKGSIQHRDHLRFDCGAPGDPGS
jgi:hypothetical protein